jgi:hypothetical protein
MHKLLHGGIGRAVFGNEKARINIGMINEDIFFRHRAWREQAMLYI